MIVFEIPYHIFPFSVLFVIGDDNTKYKEIKKCLKKYLHKSIHKEIKYLKGIYDARCVMFSTGKTAVVLTHTNYIKDKTVEHEIFHAIHFLFDRIEIKLSMETNEIFA